jgi:membrane-bound lytic murein transglycosylase B
MVSPPLFGAAVLWAILAVSEVNAAAPPEVPPTPAAAAAALMRVEGRLADLSLSVGDLVQDGHLQQRIYRKMGMEPEWGTALIAALPDEKRAAAAANQRASARIASTVGKGRTSLPAWEIHPAAPFAELEAAIRQAASAEGLPFELLAAVMLVETRMGRLHGVSSAGAMGPMQFIPATWARFGEGDVNDLEDALRAAARHLRHHGAPKDTSKALWHYNQSTAYGEAVMGFANAMATEPWRFRGYYHWQVYYRTVRGPLWLPEGYAETREVPLEEWCARASCVP